MSVVKKYLKSKPICKVTFKLAKEAVNSAKSVHIVGEFNGWDPDSTPMKKLKTGGFTATLELEKDREYQFRYFINRETWENDWEADKYVPSPVSDAENSVIVV